MKTFKLGASLLLLSMLFFLGISQSSYATTTADVLAAIAAQNVKAAATDLGKLVASASLATEESGMSDAEIAEANKSLAALKTKTAQVIQELSAKIDSYVKGVDGLPPVPLISDAMAISNQKKIRTSMVSLSNLIVSSKDGEISISDLIKNKNEEKILYEAFRIYNERFIRMHNMAFFHAKATKVIPPQVDFEFDFNHAVTPSASTCESTPQ
ncbi:MAG: hypothetical protein HQK52_14265 [Oligoflexia bacterium]|nr:hypothetical protein [Oligoflexia bacterium]